MFGGRITRSATICTSVIHTNHPIFSFVTLRMIGYIHSTIHRLVLTLHRKCFMLDNKKLVPPFIRFTTPVLLVHIYNFHNLYRTLSPPRTNSPPIIFSLRSCSGCVVSVIYQTQISDPVPFIPISVIPIFQSFIPANSSPFSPS